MPNYEKNKQDTPKIVVFDLDETLGQFIELGIFIDALQEYLKHSIAQPIFNKLCDLFPEFFRSGIFVILQYLKVKKQNGQCKKVIIYTNNHGPEQWTYSIKNYLNAKLNYKLFDSVIGAHDVYGKLREDCRKSNDKSVHDVINCSKLPDNVDICFLDDKFHPLMKQKNVYYIHLPVYTFSFSYYEMILRFLNSNISNIKNPSLFINFMKRSMNGYSYRHRDKSNAELKYDFEVSQRIKLYLQDFFS